MGDLKEYFNSLTDRYHCDIHNSTEELPDDQLSAVPAPLHSLYQLISQASLPFGEIFTLERALQESQRKPFQSQWFVFGRDRYFTFWLCLYHEDADGLSFTSWDHGSGAEIGDAADEDFISFMQSIEEDYNEDC